MAAERVDVDGKRVVARTGIEQIKTIAAHARIGVEGQTTCVQRIVTGAGGEARNFDALPARLDGRAGIDHHLAGLGVGQPQNEVEPLCRCDDGRHHVDTRAAVIGALAGTAHQPVIAGIALEHVLVVATPQIVVARSASELEPLGVGKDHIGVATDAGHKRLVIATRARTDIANPMDGIGPVHVQRVDAIAAIEGVLDIVGAWRVTQMEMAGIVVIAAIQRVGACSARPKVIIPGQPIDDVGPRIADNDIVQRVAGDVDAPGVVGDDEVLDLRTPGVERVVDQRIRDLLGRKRHRLGGGINRVIAFVSQFLDGVALAVDIIGVVTLAADHMVTAGAAVDDVVEAVTDNGVASRIAGGVGRRAGDGQVLNAGIASDGVAQRCVDDIGAIAIIAAVVDNIEQGVHVIGVVALAADHGVVAFSAIEKVVAGAADQGVISGVAVKEILSANAAEVVGGRGAIEGIGVV